MAGGKPALALSPEVQRLAALPILVIVATKRPDGSVQLNPVWFELADGNFWLNSNTRRAWPRNLQRDREATLLLVDPKEADRYAQIRGRLAEVIPDPKNEFIDRLARRYTGEPFRELEPGEERITFKIEPVAVTGQMV
jgi:PPOX class probable F420-dependent enzyme